MGKRKLFLAEVDLGYHPYSEHYTTLHSYASKKVFRIVKAEDANAVHNMIHAAYTKSDPYGTCTSVLHCEVTEALVQPD